MSRISKLVNEVFDKKKRIYVTGYVVAGPSIHFGKDYARDFANDQPEVEIIFLKISQDGPGWIGGRFENAYIFGTQEEARQAAQSFRHTNNRETRIIEIKHQVSIEVISDVPIDILDALAEVS